MADAPAPPKLFISYSWTSSQHEQWVVDLAEKLVGSNVDVKLDKWDLRVGQDAIVFMEQMVTDSTIRKVLMIVDKNYAEKANAREGGVGTETQIISKEMYDDQQQDKFAALVLDKNAKGNVYLPAYYKSRIYINFSEPQNYEKEFDKLLRWIFDKPLHVRPAFGKSPAFVSDETRNDIPTKVEQPSATKAIKDYKDNSSGYIVDYISKSGDPFSAWYCGITKDPTRKLFKEHNVSKDSGRWCYLKCANHTEARSVEKILLEYGCDGDGGGGGGGDASSVFVYVYKKTLSIKTTPHQPTKITTPPPVKPATPSPVKAFISHSTTDKKYANALRTAFKKYHIDAFVSGKDIKGGQLWQKKIRTEINDMKIFIAIHTDAFSASLWCQQETGMALVRENEVEIIPINSKLQKVPQSVLTNFQYINRGTKNTETVVKEIIDMLKTSDKIKINH